MANERRKRKFINSWAQLSIALEVVLHALLLVTLIALLLFAPPFVTMFSSYPLEDHQAIARDLFNLNISKWPLFIGLAIFTGLVSILFSHHVVGPGYKFQQVLSALNERRLDVFVKLRKWDYLIEVQDELNKHIARLREDLQQIRASQRNASALLKDRKVEEAQEELKRISQVIEQYRGFPQDS